MFSNHYNYWGSGTSELKPKVSSVCVHQCNPLMLPWTSMPTFPLCTNTFSVDCLKVVGVCVTGEVYSDI